MATIFYIMGILLVNVLGITHCPDAVIIGISIIQGAYMICETIKDKDK